MAEINTNNIPYPDFQSGDVIDAEKFDANNKALVDKQNEIITHQNGVKHELERHKISGDHDDRYVKKTEGTLFTEQLAQHKNSDDHDDRYALNSKVDILEKEVRNVVLGSTNAEVGQARVGADGTSYRTLKERVDAEYGKVSEQLTDMMILVGKRLAVEMYDNERISRAINSLPSSTGGNVFLQKGEWVINPNTKIEVPENVSLMGSGLTSTTLHSFERRTVKMFEVKGNNVRIEGIGIDLHEYDDTTNLTEISCIEVNNSIDNLIIENCGLKNGYAGVWLNPINGANISNVIIKNNLFFKLRHHIYLGYTKLDTENRTDRVSDVLIDGNIIKDGLFDGDGIKTFQNCNNITISNNFIAFHKRDGIDLYTSGDNIIVTGNVISGNGETGIDIKNKLTPTYPSEIFGYNRRILITNNIIDDNFTYGVKIADGGVYLVDVSNNSLTGNRIGGIYVHAKNVNITNNLIHKNCKVSSGASIYLDGLIDSKSTGINVSGNQILNNGVSGVESYGIKCFAYVEDSSISNNMIVNDALLPNAFQQVGVYIGGTCKNINWKGNKVKGHLRDIWIKRNSDIDAECITIPISDQTLTSALIDINALFVQKNVSIIDATFINGVTTPSGNVYLNLRLRKRVNGALESSNIASVNSQSSGFLAHTPIKINSFADNDINSDNNIIKANEVLVATIQAVGGGIELKGSSIAIRYIVH